MKVMMQSLMEQSHKSHKAVTVMEQSHKSHNAVTYGTVTVFLIAYNFTIA